jgi:hypothetical protein
MQRRPRNRVWTQWLVSALVLLSRSLRDSPLEGDGFELAVPRHAVKVSRAAHVGSA